MGDNSQLWIRKGREQLTFAEKLAPNMTAAERVQAAQAYALLAIATCLRGDASSTAGAPTRVVIVHEDGSETDVFDDEP